MTRGSAPRGCEFGRELRMHPRSARDALKEAGANAGVQAGANADIHLNLHTDEGAHARPASRSNPLPQVSDCGNALTTCSAEWVAAFGCPANANRSFSSA